MVDYGYERDTGVQNRSSGEPAAGLGGDQTSLKQTSLCRKPALDTLDVFSDASAVGARMELNSWPTRAIWQWMILALMKHAHNQRTGGLV